MMIAGTKFNLQKNMQPNLDLRHEGSSLFTPQSNQPRLNIFRNNSFDAWNINF